MIQDLVEYGDRAMGRGSMHIVIVTICSQLKLAYFSLFSGCEHLHLDINICQIMCISTKSRPIRLVALG